MKLVPIILLLLTSILSNAQYPYRDTSLQWGVIDANRQILADPAYDTVYFFKDGYAIAKKSGKYCHLNTKGQEVYAPQYDSVGYFDYNYKGSGYSGLAVAKKGNYYGLINTSGVPPSAFALNYDWVKIETPQELAGYQEPLVFIYQKAGKYGCKINGQPIGKPVYDSIYINFGNPKHLFFEKNKKLRYLTEKGKIKRTKKKEFVFWAVGDPLYSIHEFLEVVEEDGLKGLRIIGSPRLAVPAQYADIQLTQSLRYILRTPEGKYGLVDISGVRMLEDEYRQIIETPERQIMVEAFSGKKGYWANGELMWPE